MCIYFSLDRIMRWRKSTVYDVLHKTTVTFLMGVTLVSAGYLGYRGLHWTIGMNVICCLAYYNIVIVCMCLNWRMCQ